MSDRNLYECIVVTDQLGNEFMYYGKHQIAGVEPPVVIQSVRVIGPKHLSVPLSEFVGEVMDKKSTT